MSPVSSEYGDDDFLSAANFDQIDELENAFTTTGDPYFHLPPRAKGFASGSNTFAQRDLFGGTVAQKDAPVGGTLGAGRAKVVPGKDVVKVVLNKKWDRGSFARHGWSKKNAVATKLKAKGKGKGRAYASDEEAWDGEDVLDDDEDEDVFLDPDFDPAKEPPPIKWEADPEEAKTWLYPVQADKPLRTYQYNIVHAALFDNTLVSLPTGLGKTFIAACVMLNYYRWFPKGKIVFLAPTRPLVAQQIKACHYICGIPQSDCIELTGHTSPALRAIAWSTKRVFYSTPQTVENDLKKGRLDPRDVTCLVVDEAHRASGDYAYVGVVRYLMSVNPHFRLLALTATPGAKVEAVQSVIDNMHIGKIEVRTDKSMDIAPYVHKKGFDFVTIPLPPAITSICKTLAGLMQISMKPLVAAGLLYDCDPMDLAPFAVISINAKLSGRKQGNADARYWPMVKILTQMAQAMQLLIIHSMTSFKSKVLDMASGGPKWLQQSSEFKDLVREVTAMTSQPGYVGHPKMEALSNMCREHFLASEGLKNEFDEPVETRVMVFCNFRDVVTELVEVLNRQSPTVKASEFVGQANSKGKGGMSQKQQIETIRKFKKGEFNVLVATSIGEEGLDIGEIDLIVCYEANKSPISMLQRVGRTGRARDGNISVLISGGSREKRNWDKAKDSYGDVQNAIVAGKVLELYNDGDRMLPKGIKPACCKVEIKAEPLKIEQLTMQGHERLVRKTTAEEKKVKKLAASKKNIPIGAKLGFMTAKELAESEGRPLEVKAAVRTATQQLRDRRKSALLDEDEEGHLMERWRQPGGEELKLVPFDSFNLHLERGNSVAPCVIRHASTLHRSHATTLRKMSHLAESEEVHDGWFGKMADAFNPALVVLWAPSEGRIKKPHPSLRRRVHEAARSSPPPTMSTQLPSSVTQALPTPPRQAPPARPSPRPSPRAPAPPPRSKPSPKRAHTPILLSSSPEAAPYSPPRPVSKRESQTIHPVGPSILREDRETFDSFGVLSSDDYQEPPAAQALTIPKASTVYSDGTVDYDAMEIGLELLSPPPAQSSSPPPPARPVVAPVTRALSPIEIPDSEDEDESKFFPVAKARPVPSSDDFGEDYSVFELDEDALRAFDNIATEEIDKKRPREVAKPDASVVLPLEEEEEEAFDMVPPKSTKKISQPPIQKRARYGVIESDASLPHNAPHPNHVSSIDDSPVVVRRPAPRKNHRIHDTSSPSQQNALAGPSRVLQSGLGSDQGDSPLFVQQKSAGLRRGRGVELEPISIVDTSHEQSRRKHKASKGKTSKPKRRKLDAGGANRIGLFDVEAVHSSADETGSSSGSDDVENSQDRAFVAADSDLDDVSSGQAKFYRDSLHTQMGPAVGKRSFMNPRERPGAVKYSRAILSQPEGHEDSPDEWSEDSFCAGDEETIEYFETSSMV